MKGKVYRQKHINRQNVKNRLTAIFVFGDNMMRQGFGGQAAAMRGEPNTVGVPTKWKPDNGIDSFFSDRDFDYVKKFIDDAFKKIQLYQEEGRDIVIPADGLGTGLADLSHRAPKILAYINAHIAALETNKG